MTLYPHISAIYNSLKHIGPFRFPNDSGLSLIKMNDGNDSEYVTLRAGLMRGRGSVVWVVVRKGSRNRRYLAHMSFLKSNVHYWMGFLIQVQLYSQPRRGMYTPFKSKACFLFQFANTAPIFFKQVLLTWLVSPLVTLVVAHPQHEIHHLCLTVYCFFWDPWHIPILTT